MPFRHDPAESLADIIENADRIEDYIAGGPISSGTVWSEMR